jgi:DtxR family transcriptional regulator, Mn-dependent transcriptional regulator
MQNRRRHKHFKHHTHQFCKKELDEYMEVLWYLQERHGQNMKHHLSDLNSDWNPAIGEILKKQDYLEETETELKFTKKGYNFARQLVRSHRLAERLLTDVLEMKIDQAEVGACEFEHIIVPEIVDGICTLLGHPKVCPHGMPIPEGACCKEVRRSVKTATKNLTELEAGQDARVAYINTQSNERMHQLTQMGIQPGTKIRVHQTYPALVVKTNSTQIALDEEVAKDILVWE